MNEIKNEESFSYTYSASRRQEIEEIRKRYLPQEDKMAQLRRLDAGVTRKGTIASVTLGSVSCLLLGNIPTLVLLAVYAACREGRKRRSDVEKMNIQDL